MEDSDREKIRSNLSRLVLRTQWNEKLETCLLTKGVFKPKMIELIKSAGTDQESWIRQLFMDVQKRGPKAFENLVGSLQGSGNCVAANILDVNIKIESLPSPIPEDTQNKVWNLPTYSVPIPETPKYPIDYKEPPLIDDREPIEINVKKATRYKGPPEMPNAYPMTKKIRGQCLIIDNEKFVNDVLPYREGSMIDSNNLDILYEQLGFKVTVRRNLEYQDMMRTINNFSKMEDHIYSQMCIVIILSHGNDGGLINAADGKVVSTEYVLRRFNNDACPALKGKPKFFVLQACRGDEVDFGYVPRLETQESEACSVDASGFLPSPKTFKQTIAKDPTWEDMVILYATVPGFVANRNLYRGTWLIECLCYVFMNYAREMDLREMLDEVARRLRGYESEQGFKQSCSYESRHFYNKLFFNPGIVKECSCCNTVVCKNK